MRSFTEAVPESGRCIRCDRNLVSSIWNSQLIVLKETPKRNFTKFICVQCVATVIKKRHKDIDITNDFFSNLINNPIPEKLIASFH